MLSLRLFIFGPKYCVKKKSAHTLTNFISGSIKQELGSEHQQCGTCAGSEGAAEGRLRVEHAFYQIMDNMKDFRHIWAVGGFMFCRGGRRADLLVFDQKNHSPCLSSVIGQLVFVFIFFCVCFGVMMCE